MGIRIDELTLALTAALTHEVAAMKDGQTVKLTVEQLLAIMVLEVFGAPEDFPEELTTALAGKLPLAGGTLTGNLTFQDLSEGINLAGGSRIYDFTDVLVMLANGSLLRVMTEDGTNEVFRADYAQTSPKFKGSDIFHTAYGTLPTSQMPGDMAADKAFRRGNLIGTVTQAAGVPTGALIEKGSNANGGYTRWADGTQICWTPSFVASKSTGPTWTSFVWTFPAAFVASPQILATVGAPSSNQIITAGATPTSGSQGSIYMNSTEDLSNQAIQGLAIGRWF